ncbi:MAG: hypothetical protein K2P33_05325, partial [Acutalibacter sp.]|nr:hypothetical protein [Acutalibacter sp.]
LYNGEKYQQMEQRLRELNDEYFDADINLGKFQEALAESDRLLEDAEQKTKEYDDALKSLTPQVEEAAREIDYFSQAAKELRAAGMAGAGAAIVGTIGAIRQEYHQVYQDAYESISGQMGLFESMSVEVDATADEIAEALESQAAYLSQYSANLQKAHDLDLDDTLLAQLSDGSVESAAYLQAIVDGGQEAVYKINDEFKKVEEGKEAFASTVRDLQVDVDKTMTDMTRRVDQAVQEMDMHASALENSRHTFQGLIDGAQSMVGSVYSAYRGVALSAMGGLQGALGLGLTVVRGYASGTQNAAPGAALVGERGPELMFFRGGETVLNAAETRALRQRGALPASQAL